jgi:anti-anti-sigma regulatory factor
MATKDDRPTLLSKVAMFVRNPTKDWSELDQPEPDQESGYDKQALKAMIERKRQNDFVRKREFDQLRKMRNRDSAALGTMARPSVFQSSMATDPDGRAVTLKKIDEIEAQMSKQWWKGKQDAGAAAKSANFPVTKISSLDALPTRSPESSTLPSTMGFEATLSSNLGSAPAAISAGDFAATEMGSGLASPVPAFGHMQPSARAPAMAQISQHNAPSGIGFSTSGLFAIEVGELTTDPELEEAAIRFANGDDAGAESGLLEAIRGDGAQPEAALSWAAALLDLYRSTGNQAKFDSAVAEFGVFFDPVTPVWSSIDEGLDPKVEGTASSASAASERSRTDLGSGAIWESPAELTAAAMEELREAMSSHALPWHVDWSQLERMSADAMPLLSGLFGSLCAEEVELRFSGAERLVQTLRLLMPSGDRSVPNDWWTVRLNALRAMHLQDEFELAALDYCVTFEVSPPAWEDARCVYEDVRLRTAAAAHEMPLPTAPMELENTSAIQLCLKGQVLGDATQALAGLDREGRSGDRIIVACGGLVRVDFSAAGSILNWVATRQAEGCLVQFRDVHRLVAAFFNVIGINEHSRVVPRPI